MRIRKTGLIFGLMAAAAVVGLCVSLSSSEGEIPPVDPRKPARLNEVLTNEKSDTSALYGLDRKVESYMRQWSLRGVSLSIMRRDSLVYSKGYGWSDAEKQKEMEPSHILRVASVSKLLTAAGIMVLQE